MVAFELARHFETAGQSSEAVKWYATAAERFRRADWKTKAQEAAARLGGGSPEAADVNSESSSDQADSAAVPTLAMPEPAAPFVQTAAAYESIASSNSAEPPQPSSSSESASEQPKRRHRGRRGGRNRRRGVAGARSNSDQSSTVQRQSPPPPVDVTPESRFTRVNESLATSRTAAEAPEAATAPRARFGDPGLSSRLTLLEMQFRRLLSCPPLRLDEPDRAPAGPGVLLLSDADLTAHYYVEDCQTLRIAIANLLRGGSGRRTSSAIKSKLAEHLGIAETRASKYLTEHCVVRYLQLDEDASHFAHFAIAVLRPALND